MKRKVIVRLAVSGVLLLLLGVLTAEAVNQLYSEPRTVSAWGELVDCYLISRTSLPPLPFSYDDVFSKMNTGDWSFLADHWQYKQTDGPYYVAKDSKLAEMKLPLHILVYEDLQRGETIILSSTDGTNFQGEALFKAPEFMPYEKDFPLARYAFDELWPRRIIWEITLKSEADAWLDLACQGNEEQTSELLGGGGMMRMMVPEEHANELWLCLEPQTNGGMNLNVFAPEGFTNRVEIYSSTDLISNVWSIAEQNLYPSGTNPAVWSTGSEIVQFYRAGNMDIDSDGDGVPDARELIVCKTDPSVPDTDTDSMPDGWEADNGLNPLSAGDQLADPDHDMLPNVYEWFYGLDPNSADSASITKLRVDPAHAGDPNTYATIQAAFNASTDYSVIEIAPGTYKGSGNTGLIFPPHPIMLMSADWGTNRCVEIQSSDFIAFCLSDGQDNRTIIRGLNITQTGNLRMQMGFYLGKGSGPLFSGAAPYFDGVQVNLGKSGWTAGFYGLGSTSGTVRFNNCIVRGSGGQNAQSGIYLMDAPAMQAVNCSFLNFNSSTNESHGIMLGVSSINLGHAAAYIEARIANCFWDSSFAFNNNYAVAHTQESRARYHTEVSYSIVPNTASLEGVDILTAVTATNASALPDGLLLSNSPCINASGQSPLSWYDFHGQLRDSMPDIGADEYSDIATTDTDGDGLTDYAEIYDHHTSIFDYDTDNDGVGDGDEIVCGTSPTNIGNYCVTILGEVDDQTGLSATVRASYGPGSSEWNASNSVVVSGGHFSFPHQKITSYAPVVQVLIDVDGDGAFDYGTEPFYTKPQNITSHDSGISFTLYDKDGDNLTDAGEVACGTDPNNALNYCVTLQGTVTNQSPLDGTVYAAAVLMDSLTPPPPWGMMAGIPKKTVLKQVAVTNGTFLINHLIVDQRGSNEVWNLWLDVYQDINTNAVLEYFEPMTQTLVSVTNHTMNYDLRLELIEHDLDSDKIPDWWEDRHGLSFTNRADAFADFDGDWIDNLWEYRLGLDPHSYNTNNYAFADAMQAVDTRIAGENPTNSIHIFNKDCYDTGIFIRNTNCWVADIDLTSISPWNSYTSAPWDERHHAGTLVSPRHVLFVNHLFVGQQFWVPAGNTLTFVDATNGVYTATIESIHHLVYTNNIVDLTVAVLTEDVPTNRFSFAKILPQNFTNYLGHADMHVPGLGLDQEEKALVRNLSGASGGWCSFAEPTYGVRANYYEGLVGGDSGNPAFIMLNNELVLMTLWVFPSGQGSFPTFFKDEINAVMNANGNYSLTEIDLSAYGTIPEALR